MNRIFYLLLLILLISSCKKSIFEDKSHDPEFIFDSWWNEIDRNYSFFQYSRINWDSVYSTYRPTVTPNTSDDKLFRLLSKMTDLLHDAHTNIYTPQGIAGNIYYFDKYQANEILLNDSYFDYYNTGRIFEYGKLKKANIGFIKIKTFLGEGKSFEDIDSILQALNTTKGIIIDVRSNFGGEISNSEIIAARFTDSTRIAGRYRVRNGPRHDDFSEWVDIFSSPLKKRTTDAKQVIILTNRKSYSATEWFVMLAKASPIVTTIGDTTGGGSAIPIVRELPNGWIIRTSNTQMRTASGYDFQFIGIYPDVPVWISAQDAEKGVDSILERAILEMEGE